MLRMLDGVLTWTAHPEHQEVWAGPSWSSVALRYDVAFIWSIKPIISQLYNCSAATSKQACRMHPHSLKLVQDTKDSAVTLPCGNIPSVTQCMLVTVEPIPPNKQTVNFVHMPPLLGCQANSIATHGSWWS
jgi:hypothetical protein